LWVFGLAFALVLLKTEAVVGAVGKWESRGSGEISKGVWEPVETWFWFFAGSHAPAFSTALFGCLADQLFARQSTPRKRPTCRHALHRPPTPASLSNCTSVPDAIRGE
jgi:hypothetical protein